MDLKKELERLLKRNLMYEQRKKTRKCDRSR